MTTNISFIYPSNKKLMEGKKNYKQTNVHCNHTACISPESKGVSTRKLDAIRLKIIQLTFMKGRLDFPNYHSFENINGSYSNFIQKVIGVIDLVAPIKSRRIKIGLSRMVRR